MNTFLSDDNLDKQDSTDKGYCFKILNEREDFLRVWLLQGITLQQRRWKTTSLDTIEFLDTHTHVGYTTHIDK